MKRLRRFRAMTWMGLALVVGCSSSGPDGKQSPVPVVEAPETAKAVEDAKPARPLPKSLSLEVAKQSHEAMLERLATVRDAAETKDFTKGIAYARSLSDRLKKLGKDGDPQERGQVELLLGVYEIRLGHEEIALEHFSKAERLMDSTAPEFKANSGAFIRLKEGLAHLRMGEVANCVALENEDSCLFPIQGGGVHPKWSYAARAGEVFLALAQDKQIPYETQLTARWLLTIASQAAGEGRVAIPSELEFPTAKPLVEFPSFVNVGRAAGLHAETLGGSLVTDDFDGDGDIDLLVSSRDSWEPIRYYSNQGDGTFRDRTEKAGLRHILAADQMVQGDYDNDGDLDVFCARGGMLQGNGRHPNSLLMNRGDGTFLDVAIAAGIANTSYPSSVGAWADYDLDGDLDLFVGNEVSVGATAYASELFNNQGDGTFTEVGKRAGVQNKKRVRGAVWGDYDNDGDPDLFVSNYVSKNRLYRNEGNGTFRDVAPQLGVELLIVSTVSWFWDYDNDGFLDIATFAADADVGEFAKELLGEEPRTEGWKLYRGGNDGFDERSKETGFASAAAVLGGNFGDLNGDGLLDVYVGTGRSAFENLIPNILLIQTEPGRFVRAENSARMGHLQKGNGVGFADLDQDGDLDVAAQMGGMYLADTFRDAIFQNPGFGVLWVGLRLEGRKANRSGIGARLSIRDETATFHVERHVSSGGSQGASSLTQWVGLGPLKNGPVLVDVSWPGSIKERFRLEQLERVHTLVEGEGKAAAPLD